MSTTAEVQDDPDRPQGGHALIRFGGPSRPPGPVVLDIECLTEGFDYRGPRQVTSERRDTPSGGVIAIGPDVTSRLSPGISVALTLLGEGLRSEVLWPVLTPVRLAATPSPIRPSARPRVVAVPSGHDKVPQKGAVDVDGRTGPSEPPLTSGPVRAVTSVGSDDAKTPEAPITPPVSVTTSSTADGTIRDKQPARDDGPAPTDRLEGAVTDPVRKPSGLGATAVLGVALLAFACGVGLTALFFTFRPSTLASRPTALPSPYAMLSRLADRSPQGTPVRTVPSDGFLARGRKAKSPDEGAFWRQWAARALVENRKTGAAATLSDFATDLANTADAGPPEVLAARFLWEFAAVGRDCAAMDNIIAASEPGGPAPDPATVEAWRGRVQQCRDHSVIGQER